MIESRAVRCVEREGITHERAREGRHLAGGVGGLRARVREDVVLASDARVGIEHRLAVVAQDLVVSYRRNLVPRIRAHRRDRWRDCANKR